MNLGLNSKTQEKLKIADVKKGGKKFCEFGKKTGAVIKPFIAPLLIVIFVGGLAIMLTKKINRNLDRLRETVDKLSNHKSKPEC